MAGQVGLSGGGEAAELALERPLACWGTLDKTGDRESVPSKPADMYIFKRGKEHFN